MARSHSFSLVEGWVWRDWDLERSWCVVISAAPVFAPRGGSGLAPWSWADVKSTGFGRSWVEAAQPHRER